MVRNLWGGPPGIRRSSHLCVSLHHMCSSVSWSLQIILQLLPPQPSLNLLVPLYTPGWREGPWGKFFAKDTTQHTYGCPGHWAQTLADQCTGNQGSVPPNTSSNYLDVARIFLQCLHFWHDLLISYIWYFLYMHLLQACRRKPRNLTQHIMFFSTDCNGVKELPLEMVSYTQS